MRKFRGTVLSRDPWVIYCGNYVAGGGDSAMIDIACHLSEQPVVFLMLVAWTAEPESPSAGKISAWRDGFLQRFQNHRLIFLANTFVERDHLRALGAEAELAHQNMFVSADLFKPIPSVNRIYDAVYNGQFLDFKRHGLASEIERLAVIGYNIESGKLPPIRESLPRAEFVNFISDGEYKWLSQKQINTVYNQSSVGLCLSRREGAMHASMEYLLAGLPIVTTQSAGGRDYFFDGRFVYWANDDPVSISRAVSAFVKENIPPQFIRDETLMKISRERARFGELLGRLLANDELGAVILQKIDREDDDKLIQPKQIEEILAR